jgi:hypothetical protein
MKLRNYFIGVVLAVGLLSAPARADVVFQSIPDINVAHVAGSTWCSGCSGSYRVFDLFSLTSATSLTEVAFAIDQNFITPQINVSIWSSSGNLPSVSLFNQTSTSATWTQSAGSSNTDVFTVNLPSWSLSAGDYWISFYSGTGVLVSPGFSGGSGKLYQLDAGYHVGESSAFILEGAVAAVPEPSTWAMLLIGFAGIGIAYRRQIRYQPCQTDLIRHRNLNSLSR